MCKMRVVAWNLNCRKDASKIWSRLENMSPDIMLLSEVNRLPEHASDWTGEVERATGHDRRHRRFSTALLTRFELSGTIQLKSKHSWVNDALAAFPGNLVARRVVTAGGAALNVVSVHMPSWRVPYQEFTDGDALEVKIPGYSPVYMSELIWSALDHCMSAHDGSWIIGGDFNTSEFIGRKKQNDANRTAIARFESLGLVEVVRRRFGGPVPTWLSAQPHLDLKHQLDHVYISETLWERVTDVRVGGVDEFGRGLSDHLPIILDLNMD